MAKWGKTYIHMYISYFSKGGVTGSNLMQSLTYVFICTSIIIFTSCIKRVDLRVIGRTVSETRQLWMGDCNFHKIPFHNFSSYFFFQVIHVSDFHFLEKILIDLSSLYKIGKIARPDSKFRNKNDNWRSFIISTRFEHSPNSSGTIIISVSHYWSNRFCANVVQTFLRKGE